MKPLSRVAKGSRAASRASWTLLFFEGSGLWLLPFLVSPITSYAAGHLFQNEKLGVSFSIPEGWSEDASLLTNKSSVAAFVHDSKISSSCISLMGPGWLPWYRLRFDLLDYAKSQAAIIQILAGAQHVPRPERVSVHGQEAVVTNSEGVVGGLTTVVMDYCFLDSKRKRVYCLRFNSSRVPSASSSEVFDADKAAFLSSVESFTIH